MSWNEPLRERLRERMRGELLFDEPAGRHTTIGVGGPVDALLFPEEAEALVAVVRFLRESAIPFLPVGNWSNLIVTDGGYRGALVSLARLRRFDFREEEGGRIRLVAEAGCALASLVGQATGRGLAGLEFCAGIPGSLGGAIRMNAGAFGGEIGELVEAALVLDASGEVRTLAGEALPFGYRTLDLPPETIIIGATLALGHGEPARIEQRVQELSSRRRERHPLDFRNAGSIFKNPPGCPAGRLIEEAGLKGYGIGDARISDKHSNFIINIGRATAAEILGLIAVVQQRVLAHCGVALETEVKVIGER